MYKEAILVAPVKGRTFHRIMSKRMQNIPEPKKSEFRAADWVRYMKRATQESIRTVKYTISNVAIVWR